MTISSGTITCFSAAYYRGPQVHDRDVTERYLIEVKDGQGHPVLGAQVRFFLPGQQRQEILQHLHPTPMARPFSIPWP